MRKNYQKNKSWLILVLINESSTGSKWNNEFYKAYSISIKTELNFEGKKINLRPNRDEPAGKYRIFHVLAPFDLQLGFPLKQRS